MNQAEQIAWTRDALERMYDIAFLQRSIGLLPGGAPIADARELQSALQRLIRQLKPTSDVPSGSLAWRIYNTLEYRYIRALTQVEAAAEMNISLRQLRREQDRGIAAVAMLLFAVPAPRNGAAAPPGRDSLSAGGCEFLRLDDLLRAVLSLIDPLLGQQNIDVCVTLPAPAPVVWSNRIVIRQLLIMLISLTIHDVQNSRLQISGRLQAAFGVRLTFHRTGASAAPPLQPDDRATLERLAREAGGELAADPGAAGFELLMPVRGRQQVLMIDDSPDAIELARRYLSGTPFDLVAVTRAEDALKQAEVLQPSCILLDVMMPGRDGWEILALLKSHGETIHIPVVVCSVLQNPDLARALGAAQILPRPHSAAQLLDALQTVIAQRLQRQAVRSA